MIAGLPYEVDSQQQQLRCENVYNYIAFVAGVVYNITAYLSFHPGGVSELMKGAGIDCTLLFDNVSDDH